MYLVGLAVGATELLGGILGGSPADAPGRWRGGCRKPLSEGEGALAAVSGHGIRHSVLLSLGVLLRADGDEGGEVDVSQVHIPAEGAIAKGPCKDPVEGGDAELPGEGSGCGQEVPVGEAAAEEEPFAASGGEGHSAHDGDAGRLDRELLANGGVDRGDVGVGLAPCLPGNRQGEAWLVGGRPDVVGRRGVDLRQVEVLGESEVDALDVDAGEGIVTVRDLIRELLEEVVRQDSGEEHEAVLIPVVEDVGELQLRAVLEDPGGEEAGELRARAAAARRNEAAIELAALGDGGRDTAHIRDESIRAGVADVHGDADKPRVLWHYRAVGALLSLRVQHEGQGEGAPEVPELDDHKGPAALGIDDLVVADVDAEGGDVVAEEGCNILLVELLVKGRGRRPVSPPDDLHLVDSQLRQGVEDADSVGLVLTQKGGDAGDARGRVVEGPGDLRQNGQPDLTHGVDVRIAILTFDAGDGQGLRATDSVQEGMVM